MIVSSTVLNCRTVAAEFTYGCLPSRCGRPQTALLHRSSTNSARLCQSGERATSGCARRTHLIRQQTSTRRFDYRVSREWLGINSREASTNRLRFYCPCVWARICRQCASNSGTSFSAISRISCGFRYSYACMTMFRAPMILAHGISGCARWNAASSRRAASPIIVMCRHTPSMTK